LIEECFSLSGGQEFRKNEKDRRIDKEARNSGKMKKDRRIDEEARNSGKMKKTEGSIRKPGIQEK
jgi:hypothetical protein